MTSDLEKHKKQWVMEIEIVHLLLKWLPQTRMDIFKKNMTTRCFPTKMEDGFRYYMVSQHSLEQLFYSLRDQQNDGGSSKIEYSSMYGQSGKRFVPVDQASVAGGYENGSFAGGYELGGWR